MSMKVIREFTYGFYWHFIKSSLLFTVLFFFLFPVVCVITLMVWSENMVSTSAGDASGSILRILDLERLVWLLYWCLYLFLLSVYLYLFYVYGMPLLGRPPGSGNFVRPLKTIRKTLPPMLFFKPIQLDNITNTCWFDRKLNKLYVHMPIQVFKLAIPW